MIPGIHKPYAARNLHDVQILSDYTGARPVFCFRQKML